MRQRGPRTPVHERLLPVHEERAQLAGVRHVGRPWTYEALSDGCSARVWLCCGGDYDEGWHYAGCEADR